MNLEMALDMRYGKPLPLGAHELKNVLRCGPCNEHHTMIAINLR
jgi:hypothetical protein